LWDAVVHVLKPGASAFVLVRPLSDHDQDPFGDLQKRLRYRAQVENFADIRGTSLVRILKI
jgi:hypothetical protein